MAGTTGAGLPCLSSSPDLDIVDVGVTRDEETKQSFGGVSETF